MRRDKRREQRGKQLRNSAFQHPKAELHYLPLFVVRTSRMVTSPLYDVLDHTNHTFSESYWSKDIKTDITKCLIYKYTSTQIQHITKCQKHQIYGIFLKRGLFKDITNDIPICQTGKYKNASTQILKYRAYNEVTEKKHVAYF